MFGLTGSITVSAYLGNLYEGRLDSLKKSTKLMIDNISRFTTANAPNPQSVTIDSQVQASESFGNIKDLVR